VEVATRRSEVRAGQSADDVNGSDASAVPRACVMQIAPVCIKSGWPIG